MPSHGSEITESEGQRQSAINVAEGNKRSAILEAEGSKESQVLRAQGSREAAILNAEGFSIGLQRIYETASGVDGNTMALQYLEMMKQLGAGDSTKWIIPMDLAQVAGPMGAAIEGLTSDDEAAGGNAAR